MEKEALDAMVQRYTAELLQTAARSPFPPLRTDEVECGPPAEPVPAVPQDEETAAAPSESSFEPEPA